MTTTAKQFSFTLERYREDPYRWYRHFRPQDPVHWGGPVTPGADGAWYLFRWAECVEVLKDPRFGKDVPRIIREQNLQLPEPYTRYIELFKDAIVFKDPPEHTRLRAAINKAFIAKSIMLRRDRIQGIISDLLRPLSRRSHFDLVEDFAFPFPIAVICDLLGTPDEDRDRIRDWTIAFTRALSGSRDLTVYDRAVNAIGDARDYLSHLLKQRRAEPRLDLLSEFANEPVGESRLTEDEVLTMFYALLSGGHETSTNIFCSTIYHLMRQPDQLADLRAHPELLDTAVDEFLRYETPVHYTFRFAYEDIRLSGKTIRRGDRVMIMLGAAARDPDAFEYPETLDVRRIVGPRAIHFGRGPHYCVGSALSPLELQLSVSSFLERFPDFALEEQDCVWSENLQFRGLTHLKVRVPGKSHGPSTVARAVPGRA